MKTMKAVVLTGFFLNLASQAVANPTITRLDGTVSESNTLTIVGERFSEKEHQKPLVWWKADLGGNPSSHGRTQVWSKSVSGEPSTEHVSDGSMQAFRFDHGESSGTAIGEILFDSDRIYLNRKMMTDFDVRRNLALRSRVTNIQGGSFKVGDLVRGEESGATAVISQIIESANRTELFFSGEGGSVNDAAAPLDFRYGEIMSAGNVSATNVEGSENYPTGLFRTFNFKTIRFWGDAGNNIFLGTQGAETNQYRLTAERTGGGTRWPDDLEFPYAQEKQEWVHEEVIYKSSTVGESDGLWLFEVNGKAVHNDPITTVTEAHNSRYNRIAQSQVSNGAQPESWVYYDSIYIDDSWHRVVLCEESEWSECSKKEIQIPQTWSDSRIDIIVNLGIFHDSDNIYFYVVDSDGNANSRGYGVCLKCPSQTEVSIE
ncbi:hypothetical protein [Marinobacter confluentis]|uniref:Uncharacterized protein n=1 Tax=Marinobacter confluentis TaxID=1697557 RepID=A0A4Z1C2K2_9GAMM|nr:hypothetical protein [Marinobacter confluentis]TGN41518.1 hypothetical protein E5Q11_03005 [Marinobacter confluentis]